jgi:gliding motility-associated-like protein
MNLTLRNFWLLFSLSFLNFVATSQTVSSFTFTGSMQTFTVPPCVTSITVKAWGAGGHKGGNDTYNGASGGGGAFVQSTITVTPGQILNIVVGGAGSIGTNCAGSAAGGVGGWGNNQINGGRGGNAGSQGCSGGGGGGGAGTGIFAGTNALVVAGGGGGGSGGGNQSAGAAAGGGGQNGFTVSGCNQGFTNNSGTGNGTQGGDRGNADGAGGGGGGGGINGGTGGSAPTGCDCGGCGGGGGGNFASGAGNIVTNGNGINPANAGDVHFVAGVGRGGTASQSSGNGLLVLIYDVPIVTASFTAPSVCFGQANTVFTNNSSTTVGTITSHSWNFGDGSSVNTQANPTYSYATPNTYSVTLTVTTNSGCSQSVTQNVVVNPSPVASFSLDESCKNVGVPITLMNTSTFANANSDQIVWTASDGTTQNNTHFSHVFSPQGTYDLTLTITSAQGCVSAVTQSVDYFNNPSALATLPDLCDGNPWNLVAQSTGFSGQTLTNSWTVNGGNTLVGNNVPFSYSGPGTYLVQLIAETSFGCKDTLTESVTIFPAPIAQFSASSACANVPVAFNNQSTASGANSVFNWNINGTSAGNGANFTYTFPSGGNYTVQLTITENNGGTVCASESTQTLVIFGIPEISVTGDLNICAGEQISLNNASTVSPTDALTHDWSVNGQTVLTSTNFQSVFPLEGTFTIILNTTSASGCTANQTFTALVSPIPPAPELNVNVVNCPGDEALLTAIVEPNATVFWSGPLNFTSNLSANNLQMFVPMMGNYAAYQVSDAGCVSQTASISVMIQNIYSFDDFQFPNVITPNNDNVNDELDVDAFFQTCDSYTLSFFNRWGQLVYSHGPGGIPFSGRTQDGAELTDGVYFYKLEYFSGGAQENGVKSGFIQVLR